MEARASLGTLHATVASKKVTAHAQCKAMGLIRTNKLTGGDTQDGHWSRQTILAVETALDLVQVSDEAVVSMIRHGVDLL